jgi:uncharacterized protein YndB with AHSA1/START domain
MDPGGTMEKNLIAKASVTVHAPKAKVWAALVDPAAINQYMFGTNVVTDWKAGGPIRWKGEWQGKAYEDKGEILKIEPGRVLQYSHFSPLSGQPDMPENYHTVTIVLADEGTQTTVALTQDNNKTEEDRKHSEKNWEGMLTSLKQFVEG